MLKIRIVALAIFTSLILMGCASMSTSTPGDGNKEVTPITGPVTSPIDTRKYQAFKLDNGLKVLVIEDTDSDRSAASLVVSVGSYDDPTNRQGLAHFLEHMLFLGTKRYPESDGFMKFIGTHAGRNNAYTAGDHTNYFFEIKPEVFREALDRFAQFFSHPLFAPAYVDKEKNAVHGEYQLQSKDDLWRVYLAQRMVFNSEHPVSKFNIGNLETLADGKTNVRDDLLDFYRDHYRSDRMALVISSPQPLSQQVAWVQQSFGDIPPTRKTSAQPPVPPLFKPGQLPAVLDILPEKELRVISFEFPVPITRPHYRTKPAGVISNALGYEGAGSLHQWLKEQGWIESLAAYSSPVWKENSIISVDIELTKAGVSNWEKIGDALFSYIRLLKEEGVEQWRFDEQSQLLDLHFQFQTKTSPLEYVRTLAANTFEYPFSDIIAGGYRMDEWEPEVIDEYLSLMTPDRVYVTRVNPDVETDSEERWFQVKYRLQAEKRAVHDRWSKADLPEGLHLPEPNTFIPERLALEENVNPVQVPTPLSVEQAQAWHMTDTSFGIPFNTLYFRLTGARESESARYYATEELYLSLVEDALNQYSYPAAIAGLTYSLIQAGGSVVLSIQGYSDRQAQLLEEVVKTLAQVPIDSEKVARYQTELEREWRNTLKERPYTRNISAVSDALIIPRWRPVDMADAVQSLTAEDVEEWRDLWFSKVRVGAFLHGNLDKAQAVKLVDIVTTAIPNSEADNLPVALQLVDLGGAGGLVVHREDVDHSDAAMALYVQGQTQSVPERARYALFSQMVGSPYFNYMRTEKQLGYAVGASNRTRVKTPAILFIAQSPSADATKLLSLTQGFIRDYAGRIQRMTQAEFEDYQSAVVARVLLADQNAVERAGRLWQELAASELGFDFRERLAAEISRLNLKDMKQFHKEFMVALKQRSFVSYNPGHFSQEIETDLPNTKKLDDFYSLKGAGKAKFSIQPAASDKLEG